MNVRPNVGNVKPRQPSFELVGIELVLDRLRRCNCAPRRSGVNAEGRVQYAAKCPAHEDHRPSLQVSSDGNGNALLRCMTGCETSDVCKALGIELADLFAERGERGAGARRGRAPVKSSGGRDRVATVETVEAEAKPAKKYDDADAALRAYGLGEPSATWTYTDSTGEPVGIVARWNRDNGKDIRPIVRNCAGWMLGGMTGPRPLYGLPDVLRAVRDGERIIVTEGERCADVAKALGYQATTSAHGSQSWHETDWTPLRGADVVILPDHDEAGEAYAADVARELVKLRATVRVVRLPVSGKGDDIADYLDAQGGDVDAARNGIEALIEATEPEPSEAEALPVVFSDIPAFPVDALPGAMATYAGTLADSLQVDASYTATALLVMTAGAVGLSRACAMKPDGSWKANSILWGAIVGASGDGKTPAMDAIRSLTIPLEDEARRDGDEARKTYGIERDRWEVQRREWRDGGCVGNPPEEPTRPARRVLVVSDVTTEGMTRALQDNPRGVTLWRDELDGWLGGMDRYTAKGGAKGGGGDVAYWLSAYSAMPIDVLRAGREDPIHIPRAAVSIIGGVQPSVVAESFGKANRRNGLVWRFMFVHPTSRRRSWAGGMVRVQGEAAARSMLRTLYGWSGDVDECGVYSPRLIEVEPDAMDLFGAFYDRTEAQRYTAASEDERGFRTKIVTLCSRLALVVSCARQAQSGQYDNVTTEDMAAAVKLAEFYAAEGWRAISLASSDENAQRQARLLANIRNAGGEVAAWEVVKNGWGGLRTSAAAEAELDALVAAGAGVWSSIGARQGTRGGRPAGKRFIAF